MINTGIGPVINRKIKVPTSRQFFSHFLHSLKMFIKDPCPHKEWVCIQPCPWWVNTLKCHLRTHLTEPKCKCKQCKCNPILSESPSPKMSCPLSNNLLLKLIQAFCNSNKSNLFPLFIENFSLPTGGPTISSTGVSNVSSPNHPSSSAKNQAVCLWIFWS